MSTSSSWLDEHDDWYPPPRSYGLPSYEEAIAESRIGPERYDNHILASYGQNAPVSLPRVTMSLPDFLMVFSLVLFCLTSLGVLLGGGTEDPTSLALNAAYNAGYHVQHSSITKPSCRVSDDLHQYNVPLPEFLRRFTPNTAPQRVSTRAAIFRNIGDEPEILLAQSKSWRLGSGGMWEHDRGCGRSETILHAAARGLEEETNVKLASLDAWVGEYTFHAPWMLWAKRNLKIMFLASVEGGDTSLTDITWNTTKYQAFCWATKAQLGNMSVLQGESIPLSRNGLEVVPKDDQWVKMAYSSQDAKNLALEAFEVAHYKGLLVSTRQWTGWIAFFHRIFGRDSARWTKQGY
ncbi:hypothetical protein N7448_011417 [Penicillium atrosanguineum]|nr:hypothetical protein N7448_011417 [Penicillium atrosanguineum]